MIHHPKKLGAQMVISLHLDSNFSEKIEECSHSRFSQVKEGESSSERWIQIVKIILGIGATLLLSSMGILSSSYLLAARISVMSISIGLFLNFLYHHIVNKDPSLPEKTEDLDPNRSIPLSYIGVYGPIIEELIFRLGVQGTLQFLFRNDIPPRIITLLGIAMPATNIAAMILSGMIFGISHYSRERNNVAQVLYTGISGIFVEGALYAAFGLAPAIFAHIINNTISLAILEILVELNTNRQRVLTQAEPAL